VFLVATPLLTTVCRLLHEELKAAGSSGHLAGLVGSAVGKALRMIAEKAEYMAAAGPELRQVRCYPFLRPAAHCLWFAELCAAHDRRKGGVNGSSRA
jgi:hypothetical protein